MSPKSPKSKRAVATKKPVRVRTERNARRATKMYLGEGDKPPAKRAVPSKQVVEQASVHATSNVGEFTSLITELAMPVLSIGRRVIKVETSNVPVTVIMLELELRDRHDTEKVSRYDLIAYPEGDQENVFYTAVGRTQELLARHAYPHGKANEQGCWRLMEQAVRLLQCHMLKA